MFLLALLVLAISAKRDTFYFHTRVTCGLLLEPTYHFQITFQEQDINADNNEDINKPLKDTLPPGGDKNLTISGALEHGDEDVNYSIYVQIYHDCTNGRVQTGKIAYITGMCRVGAFEDCHVHVDVQLDGSVVSVLRVEQDPDPSS